MTLIASSAFDRARREVPPAAPTRLIGRMHQLVQNALKQDSIQGESYDGMELGVCYPSKGNERMIFAGARFSLFTRVHGKPLMEIKGHKRGIGYRKVPYTQEYSEVEVDLTPGMSYYMNTDRLLDQIGSLVRRGLGKAGFVQLITRIGSLPMVELKEIVLKTLIEHQGEESRRDDVSVVGFQLKS